LFAGQWHDSAPALGRGLSGKNTPVPTAHQQAAQHWQHELWRSVQDGQRGAKLLLGFKASNLSLSMLARAFS
jgi:hypothetical protein